MARAFFPPVSRANSSHPRALLAPPTFPGVPYVLRPSTIARDDFGTNPRGYFDDDATLPYRINSLAFRGPETTLAKPPGVRRIIGIGDSFLFGIGVRFEHTLLSALERRLDDAGGLEYEVLNLGVAGFDTQNEVAALKHVGLPLEPDLVILCFFPNDAGSIGTCKFFNSARSIDEVPVWRRFSRVVDLAQTRLERRSVERELVESYLADFADDAPGWLRVQAALRRLGRLSTQESFAVAVVVYPVLFHLSDGYPLGEIHAKVSAYSAELGFHVLDLLPYFDGYEGSELWCHPNNQHPNEVAHEIAGEALFEFLREENLVL